MSAARLASSNRLLHGIKLLDKQNEIELRIALEKRSSIQFELQRLLKLIGEKNYADARLLLPWTRRIAKLSRDNKLIEEELAHFRQKALKLSRSIDVLSQRIRAFQVDQQDEEMSDLLSSWVGQKF